MYVYIYMYAWIRKNFSRQVTVLSMESILFLKVYTINASYNLHGSIKIQRCSLFKCWRPIYLNFKVFFMQLFITLVLTVIVFSIMAAIIFSGKEKWRIVLYINFLYRFQKLVHFQYIFTLINFFLFQWEAYF